jgi:senataxin
LLASADVIFCTLSSSGGLLMKYTSSVDDLIVDEAAASTEPELCVPLHMNPSRLLVVGDPQQLPATVLSRRAEQLGLARSLQERLMYGCQFASVMLEVQYRMHPHISKFPSTQFYQGRLHDGDNVCHGQYGGNIPLLLNAQPYTFLQINGIEEQNWNGSYRNFAEAEAVLILVQQLQQRTRINNENADWYNVDRIRIITFYQAQVSCIQQLFRQHGLHDKIMIATVDSSQGCEADIVIVSFVRSPPSSVPVHNNNNHMEIGNHPFMSQPNTILSNRTVRQRAGFLTDNRRLNVALTRARYQLICVGNIQGFAHVNNASPDGKTLSDLASDAHQRNVINTSMSMGNRSTTWVADGGRGCGTSSNRKYNRR